ncbi:MAG: DUF3224 domain-containing protein [Pseudomonadota bacterium]|nr:DUF3224 domain-containing protein [Pseudomonadota bacterium]
MPQVKGEFEVKRSMEPGYDLGDGVQAMHVRFDKQFSGPLAARSVVHMLALMTTVENSAAYVAVERIVGSLDGREGSFLATHKGVMTRGEPSLDLTVVPDSGTDDLAGLGGSIAIDIVDGRHYYTFDYEIEED